MQIELENVAAGDLDTILESGYQIESIEWDGSIWFSVTLDIEPDEDSIATYIKGELGIS